MSADRLSDDKGGPGSGPAYYFLAKIEVGQEALRALPDVKLAPGMPAEVMIKTGKTTVAVYTLSPILDCFHRAFREK